MLNDFWSTMNLPWRPAIQLIVTAPLDLVDDVALGPAVLTLLQRYVMLDGTNNLEEVILLGGWVLSAVDDSPLPSASVQRLVGTGGNARIVETVQTDSQGRFVFTGLRGNTHRLNAAFPGLTDLARTVNVVNATFDDHIFRLN